MARSSTTADLVQPRGRSTSMNRAEFLFAAAAAPFALRERPAPLAFATADDESHIAVVDIAAGTIRSRIPTRPGPRRIESVGAPAGVARGARGELAGPAARQR